MHSVKKKLDLHLAIDAMNIQSGGGLTHLTRLLDEFNPSISRISRITIWTNQKIANYLPNYPWLIKKSPFCANKNLFFRFFYQQVFLVSELKKNRCSILFSPGGTIPFVCNLPVVTMSQNMLPFEKKEAKHFGKYSLMRLKMWLLKFAQGHSFKRANGVIFLTSYAENSISKFLNTKFENKIIIPHGIESRFFNKPRVQLPIKCFTTEKPFKLLYVSILMPYKHQCEIARAAKILYDKGLNIEVKFIGANWGWYGRIFFDLIKTLDPNHNFLYWDGFKSFEELHLSYKESDAFIFGSSCENLPNIILEAMASGLPIASSMYGPMPEILGEFAVYFDPKSVPSIVTALTKLLNDDDMRKSLGLSSYNNSLQYSWSRCANETFDFIYNTANRK